MLLSASLLDHHGLPFMQVLMPVIPLKIRNESYLRIN